MNVGVQHAFTSGVASGVLQSTAGSNRPAFETASSIPFALEFELIERDA